MIDEIDDDARTYLSAVGALAVYIATQDGTVVRVGFCRDPRKALAYLARAWPRAGFAWAAWFEDSKRGAANFVAEIGAHASDLIVGRRDDHVKTTRPLPFVIAHVETIAIRYGITLTPHASAIQRAKIYAKRLDVALNDLQRFGHFGAFNHAYRVYREQRRLAGESAAPYWAVREQMRQIIIRWLVTHARLDQNALLEEIRQRFPWFIDVRNVRTKRALTKHN
jgi:hypothetical protein